MNDFYAALNQTGTTKAAALQAAQRAMITGDHTAIDGERAGIGITNERGQQIALADDMSHPYYWAPFILIGNGL